MKREWITTESGQPTAEMQEIYCSWPGMITSERNLGLRYYQGYLRLATTDEPLEIFDERVERLRFTGCIPDGIEGPDLRWNGGDIRDLVLKLEKISRYGKADFMNLPTYEIGYKSDVLAVDRDGYCLINPASVPLICSLSIKHESSLEKRPELVRPPVTPANLVAQGFDVDRPETIPDE